MPNGMPKTRKKIKLELPAGRKAYFVSDVHLGWPEARQSREREKKFVEWLETIEKNAGALFLVGDIFDFWFDYRHAVPKNFTRTLGQLARMTDRGIPVYFFYGNHDMWAGDYFRNETGMEIVPDEAEVLINGKKFYVAHGDGLGPGDSTYKFLKKIFRHPLAQWLYRWLHPDLGIPLAGFFSRLSRQSADPDITRFLGPEREHLIQHSLQVLRNEPFDYFVYGHRHHTARHELKPGIWYFNIGDWISLKSYAVFDEKDLKIHHFETNINKNDILNIR